MLIKNILCEFNVVIYLYILYFLYLLLINQSIPRNGSVQISFPISYVKEFLIWTKNNRCSKNNIFVFCPQYFINSTLICFSAAKVRIISPYFVQSKWNKQKKTYDIISLYGTLCEIINVSLFLKGFKVIEHFNFTLDVVGH